MARNTQDVIVRTVAKLVAPFAFLFGIYILVHGHLTPGGGFAGGTILCASFVVLLIAYGHREVRQRILPSTTAESLGGLLFFFVGISGFFVGAPFLSNFFPKGVEGSILSAGFIPLLNVGIGVKVSGALLTMVFIILMFSPGDGGGMKG